MAGESPLLSRSPPSDHSSAIEEEEDALLTGQRTHKHASPTDVARSRWWRELGLFVWAVLATAAVVVLAVVYQHGTTTGGAGRSGHGGGGKVENGRPEGKRNLVFMVSDGMGPTSMSLTRSWRQFTEVLPYNETLVLDQYLVGQSRTRSSSSLVTDSAAGATAFSCGAKSYNGAISVLPDFSPCGSVMEAAKRMGYTTGLVVTTR
ncbi:vacuolar alkaline phosphatase, partial [Teratosphaeriaceae sp. CCFEE 6253]